MENEFAKFDEVYERVKTNPELAARFARFVDGAAASVKNMDGIAADLYAIGKQNKTEEEIKTEYKAFAAGLMVNGTAANGAA